MCIISGRVVLKTAGVGIPGLIVGSIYDVADNAQSDKIWAQCVSDGNPASMAALGSVLTNTSGEYVLTVVATNVIRAEKWAFSTAGAGHPNP